MGKKCEKFKKNVKNEEKLRKTDIRELSIRQLVFGKCRFGN